MILGTFCGSTTFDSYIYGPMDGGSLVFEFATDSSTVYSGFQVRYSSVGASFPLLHVVFVIFVLGVRRYQAIDWYAGVYWCVNGQLVRLWHALICQSSPVVSV